MDIFSPRTEEDVVSTETKFISEPGLYVVYINDAWDRYAVYPDDRNDPKKGRYIRIFGVVIDAIRDTKGALPETDEAFEKRREESIGLSVGGYLNLTPNTVDHAMKLLIGIAAGGIEDGFKKDKNGNPVHLEVPAAFQKKCGLERTDNGTEFDKEIMANEAPINCSHLVGRIALLGFKPGYRDASRVDLDMFKSHSITETEAKHYASLDVCPGELAPPRNIMSGKDTASEARAEKAKEYAARNKGSNRRTGAAEPVSQEIDDDDLPF